MEQYKGQKTEYLEGLRDRIIEEGLTDGYSMEVCNKISEILEERKKQTKEELPCGGTCGGACGLACKNL